MIRINLLPIKQLRQRQHLQNEIIAFLAGLLAFFAVLGLVGMSQAKKIDGLKVKTAKLKKEKKKYQSVINQIERIKKEQLLLETKLNVIKSLKVNSQRAVRVMDEIANITPSNRMWLTSMNFNSSKVNLAGTALDNATIASFMKALDKSLFFSGAELSKSAMATVANQRLKSFSLTINVNQPTSGSGDSKK